MLPEWLGTSQINIPINNDHVRPLRRMEEVTRDWNS